MTPRRPRLVQLRPAQPLMAAKKLRAGWLLAAKPLTARLRSVQLPSVQRRAAQRRLAPEPVELEWELRVWQPVMVPGPAGPLEALLPRQ